MDRATQTELVRRIFTYLDTRSTAMLDRVLSRAGERL